MEEGRGKRGGICEEVMDEGTEICGDNEQKGYCEKRRWDRALRSVMAVRERSMKRMS